MCRSENPIRIDQRATTKLCGEDIRASASGQGDLPRGIACVGIRPSHNLGEVSIPHQIVPSARAGAGCAGPALRGAIAASGWAAAMGNRYL